RGLVRSLRQPDRNTTGVYVPQNAFVAKRFEILRELLPGARSILVMADVHSRDQVAAARTAAEASGVRLTLVEFHQPPYDFRSKGASSGACGSPTAIRPAFTCRRTLSSPSASRSCESCCPVRAAFS